MLAVIFYHADHSLVPGGYAGVDIFFVISGFLITSMILKDHAAGTFSLSKFWERRVRRIFPAMMAMMGGTLIAALIILFPRDLKSFGMEVVAQSFFSANFLFAAQAGYSDLQSTFKPLLHMWSLAVEEQFYLLFPILMMACLKVSRRRTALWLGILLVISYLICIVGSLYDPSPSFYLLPMRSWEFLIGALLPFLPRIVFSRFEYELLSATALSALFYTFFCQEDFTTNLWAVMVLPCVATAMLLWLQPHSPTWIGRLLSLAPVRAIGIISYSLYLWHWPVFIYASYLSVRPLNLSEIFILLAAVFVMSGLSWALIERPVRQKKILPGQAQLFRAALLGSITFALLGGAIYISDGAPWRFSSAINTYAAAAESNDLLDRCLPSPVYKAGRDKLCHIGPRGAKPEYLVFGDSFALAQIPVLEKAAASSKHAGLIASHNSCPPLFDVNRPGQSGIYHCREFNDAIKAVIVQSGVKNVMLVARWSAYGNLYMLSEDGTDDDWVPEQSPKVFIKALRATVRELQSQGISVWIVQAPPEYPFDVPRRLAATVRSGGDPRLVGQSLADYHQNQALFKEALQGLSDVRMISFEKVMCTEDWCQTELGGISLYRDTHHFSAQGALLMEPQFADFFESLK